MRNSLKKGINELLSSVINFELNVNGLNEKTIKIIVTGQLDTFISHIKRKKFIFDITSIDMKKIDVIIESPLNLHPEMGPVITLLLTGEEQKKMYFES